MSPGRFGRQLRNIGWLALLVVLLLGLNAILEKAANHYQLIIIESAGVYVILAVSLNLVNGFTGQFSIGHAGFFGIGAYVGAAFVCYGEATFFKHMMANDGSFSPVAGGFVLLLAMLVGGAAAAVAGWLIGLPSLNLRGDYLAIVTLGFNEIIVVIIQNLGVVGGALGFSGLNYHDQTYYIPPLTTVFWVYLVAALLIIMSLNLKRSVQGLAFLSVREDEIAAEAMGIPTTSIKIKAFVISAFFAGVAGVLFAHYQDYLTPGEFDFMQSINIVVMVVFGGMGSVTGTAIGALVLTGVPEALRAVDQYRLVIYSLLLIVLMLIRPKGIFGSAELDRAWLRGQVKAIRSFFAGRSRRVTPAG